MAMLSMDLLVYLVEISGGFSIPSSLWRKPFVWLFFFLVSIVWFDPRHVSEPCRWRQSHRWTCWSAMSFPNHVQLIVNQAPLQARLQCHVILPHQTVSTQRFVSSINVWQCEIRRERCVLTYCAWWLYRLQNQCRHIHWSLLAYPETDIYRPSVVGQPSAEHTVLTSHKSLVKYCKLTT